MAQRFVEDSMLDMGSLNPHGRFVHVYINGAYWGQYHLRERLVSHFLADYLGGEAEDYLKVRGNDNVGSSFIPGTPVPAQRHSWYRVRDQRSSYQSIKAYLDCSHLIDFMILWSYGNCETEYRAAGPVAAGSGFKFWIADADGFLRTSALGRDRTNNSGPGALFGALVAEKDPEFMMLLADRIGMHLRHGGALTPEANTARLEERMAEIQNSLIAECARWGYRTPSNWEAAAKNITGSLFQIRTEQLLGYFRDRGWYPVSDPPSFSQQGGPILPGFRLSVSAELGTIYYTLDGTDPRLPNGNISTAALIYQSTDRTVSLVPAGAHWRYWNSGTEPVGDWTLDGYDDGAWASGPAQLGYGDGDEATVIGYGSNASEKILGYYFRHAFSVNDPAALTGHSLRLLRDDGAIVYLNGLELTRSNMPSGPVTVNTTASGVAGGGEESQWFTLNVAPEQLKAGTNLLAVEVHQANATSSDLSFALSLAVRRSQVENPIVLTQTTTVSARTRSSGQWSGLNRATFVLKD